MGSCLSRLAVPFGVVWFLGGAVFGGGVFAGVWWGFRWLLALRSWFGRQRPGTYLYLVTLAVGGSLLLPPLFVFGGVVGRSNPVR